MPFFSFAKQKKDATIALFDIGSASVGGALASIPLTKIKEKRLTPTIRWSRRKEIPFQSAVDIGNFPQQIFNALKEIIQMMSIASPEHPSMLLCTFSSPWYTAQTRIARSVLPKPSIISPQIIEALADAETAAFRTARMPPDARKEASDYLTPLEQKIMRIRLNGYATAKPYAKRAQDIDIAMYVSMSPRVFIDTVRELLLGAFHRAIDHEHSLAFISFSALRDIYPERDHFLMCDIGGEITEVSLIRDGYLVETVSFPKGRMTLLRDMVSSLGRPPEEVMSMLSLSLGGLHKEGASSPLTNLIAEGRNAWLALFREALMQLGSRNALADEIEITAHPIMRRFIEPVFTDNAFDFGAGAGARKLKPHFIDASFLRAHVSFAHAEQFDPFLALEALFADKLLNLASETI
ncbi:MAG: hypothetical protein HYT28_03465 [Parcubacteria group bacterium]|nr:hypothetical protein [Parcubacteria group bacterium]